jgi:hypothetical protein
MSGRDRTNAKWRGAGVASRRKGRLLGDLPLICLRSWPPRGIRNRFDALLGLWRILCIAGGGGGMRPCNRTHHRSGWGRQVLALLNLVMALGLSLLAAAQGVVGLCVGWALLGVGMTLGPYDAAFATLAALYGSNARSATTGITLIAGFASTIGWPLTAPLKAELRWLGTCLV